jgi:prevent-host-death family protein
MKRILISEFKAKCIELLKRVQATRQPLVVTLRGKPVAKIVPFEESGESGVKLGSRIGHAVFKGDVVRFDFSDEWEMNRWLSYWTRMSGCGQLKLRRSWGGGPKLSSWIPAMIDSLVQFQLWKLRAFAWTKGWFFQSAQRRGSKIQPEICTFNTWMLAMQSHSKRTLYRTRFTAIRLIGFWRPRRGRTKQPY